MSPNTFIKEFKEFAIKGNVVDLAVGVIIGSVFGKIVSSLVSDIIMPLLSVLTGGVNLSERQVILKQAVGKAPAVVLRYGSFLQNVLDFLIISLVIFLMVKFINRLRRRGEISPPLAPPPPPPSPTEVLLREIRDELRKT